jgi:hypothetical protein
MTTIAPEKRPSIPERRLSPARVAARLELFGLQNWILAIMLLAPLALLWGRGLWFALGFGYLIAYVGLMAIPTSLNLLLTYDALRVWVGRPAAVLPWMLGMYLFVARGRQPGFYPRATLLSKLAVLGNPLVMLAGEIWALACRYRPETLPQINADAKRYADQMRGRPPQIIVFEVHELSRDFVEC